MGDESSNAKTLLACLLADGHDRTNEGKDHLVLALGDVFGERRWWHRACAQ